MLPLRLTLHVVGFLLISALSRINGECINTTSNCGPGCYQEAGETTSCGFACIARVCRPVGEGHYSLNDDNERLACPRATYSNITEGATCYPCPSDTYNDKQGQANCKACPFGTHTSDQIGQDSIMDCSPIPSPLPTETPTPLPSRLPVTSQPSTRPSPTPSGALTSTSAPYANVGSDAPSSQPSTTSHQPSAAPSLVERSLAPTFSPSNQPSMASTSISSTPSLALSPSPSAPPSFNETTCPVGYTGPSCRECCSIANMGQGHCESGASRRRYFVKNGRCRQCPSKSTSILIGIATLVVFISLLIAYREMPTRTPALFYIGLDYLQLLSFLGTATPFKWPRVVDDTLVSLAVFNFDLDATLSPECVINMSHDTKELLVLSLLVALGVGITIIFMTAKRDSFMDKFVSIALGLYYFAYLQLTSSSFEAMVGSGTKSLIIAGVIAFKVYGISFPLLVGRSLLRREARREIKSASEETPTTTNGKSNGPSSSAARRCWILYGPFQSARWYWSVVVLGRKLWLVVATSLWRGKPMVLGGMLVSMFALWGVMNYLARPYTSFSQEMTHLARRQGLDSDKEDGNVAAVENTEYQRITTRRNVDLLLHLSLCLVVAIGTASTRIVGGNNNDRKGETALSFGALVVVVSSIYLLVWSLWTEISHLGQFKFSHRPRVGDRVNDSPRSIERSSCLCLRRRRGSIVVPSDEPSSSNL